MALKTSQKALKFLVLCVLRHFVKSLGFGWIWILKKLNTEFELKEEKQNKLALLYQIQPIDLDLNRSNNQ